MTLGTMLNPHLTVLGPTFKPVCVSPSICLFLYVSVCLSLGLYGVLAYQRQRQQFSSRFVEGSLC